MRALVVDDSPAARQIAEAALESASEQLGLDVDVVIADGGVAALKVLASSEVSILVVDLHMPDLHGLEVLNFWRQRRPESGGGLAVVVSTAVSERDREKAMAAGASAFIEKPLSAEALMPHLQSVEQSRT